MKSHKPTHLRPHSEEEKMEMERASLSGTRKWWGGVRWERNKKYGGGKKHKGRDGNGRMIPDSGRS